MKTGQSTNTSWRIAVVSLLRHMDAQHCLTGLYSRADQSPEVWVRKFNEEERDFRRDVLHPLRAWQPHGLIVRVSALDTLEKVRAQFPLLPIVSMAMAPSCLVNTAVVGDLRDSITRIRDYFHKCGLSNVAVFRIVREGPPAGVADIYRDMVPQGIELSCPLAIFLGRTPAEKKRQRQLISHALRELPKPVGIMTRETVAGQFLLAWCKELGLRVPEEVQIVGADEEDLCLEYEPRLTSFVPPYERIGEAALDTLLRLLRREQPLPPTILRVSGGTLVPRGSTAMLRIGEPAVVGAIARMQAGAARGLRAGEVIRHSKVGHTTLYKQFSTTTGNTPGRYLRKMRLEEACRQLRETNDTVTAIAAACGFTSLQSFVNFFRRQTGQTPTQYREAEKMRDKKNKK